MARRLGSEPGTSLVLSDVAEQSLAATVAAVDETGAPAATLLADVSDPAQVDAVVALAVERFGRLDVLVSNAGVLAPNGRIHNLSSEDWERSFRINVLGAVNGIRAAVGVMRPQGSGSIILTASVAGLTAWSHSAPLLRHQGGRDLSWPRWRRSSTPATASGSTASARGRSARPSTTGCPSPRLDAIAERHPLGLGSAGDLVGAYAYLAGDESRWTTGAALVIDGGYSAP